MRAISAVGVAVFASLFVAACGGMKDDDLRNKQNRTSKYGGAGTSEVPNYTPPPAPSSYPTNSPTPTVPVETEETFKPQPTPPPVTEAKKEYPTGTPVPGKTGFVTSPYAPHSGYVDVRGFPQGMEVKDPYTGKVFLVP